MNAVALSQRKLTIPFIESTFLISILGAARFSVIVSGVHFKIAFLFLILSFLMRFFNKRIKFSLLEILFFLLFLEGAVGASYFSKNIVVSVYYLWWIFFSFVVVYGLFKSIVKEHGFVFIKESYLCSFRVQIVLSALFYPILHAANGRVSLYYYEPSYYAIAAIPYVCLALSSLFNGGAKKLWVDIFFVLILLFVTKSANLMLIIISAFTFSFFLGKGVRLFKKLQVVSFLFVLFVIFAYVVFVLNKNSLIVDSISNIMESKDSLNAILLRTGNRWPRIELTLDVIRHVFPYGVGPGVFKDFTLSYTPEHDYSGGFSWLDPSGLPAVSIWLEVLVECGLFGAIGFYSLCLFIFRKTVILLKNKDMLMPICSLLVFFVSLSFESSYLRLYFWAFLGIISGIFLHEKKYDIRYEMVE